MSSKLNRKNLLRAALALFTVGSLLLFGAWLFPEKALVVDSGRVQADVIVLLGGGSGERPKRAAELFAAGCAPRIIVSGEGDAQGNRLLLMHRGVPSKSIVLEPDSRTTRENALFCLPLLRASGAKRVIVVTSWYHSRRALRCFRHYAPELSFYSCPSYYGISRRDWAQERLRRKIRVEYVKILGYWCYYGVCPF